MALPFIIYIYDLPTMKNISQLIIVADVSSDIISSQNIDDFSRIQT
jgi:hypothetical protein